MSHSMHSLGAKPRFDPYVSTPKHIPISSSRFDYTYRVPPRIPSNSVSPWESPAPASGMASPALPRTNGLDSDAGTPVRVKQEQTREMDSSCANSTADVQVRRLSSLLDRTYINPPPPDRTHNGEPFSQFSHWTSDTSDQNQTSNTDVVMPQLDIRHEQLQEQHGADHARRPWEETDSRRLPVAASIADGYTNVLVTATLRQHKKSLSDYKL
ncbi:hypothetical protein GGI24_000363 [Coemansia furcata]|nr:hypothetical protein GGI24_000363 [Coemansia furcata]